MKQIKIIENCTGSLKNMLLENNNSTIYKDGCHKFYSDAASYISRLVLKVASFLVRFTGYYHHSQGIDGCGKYYWRANLIKSQKKYIKNINSDILDIIEDLKARLHSVPMLFTIPCMKIL